MSSAELKAALNDTQLQVLELLGKGVAPAVVASTLDISPGYISQCQDHPVFMQELQATLLMSQLAASQRDEELDAIEDLLIEKVKSTAVYITKPMEAMKALDMINGMKRRGLGEGQTGITNNVQTVVLNLPSHIRPSEVQTVVSAENEVVQVDGRNMITKSSQLVMDQLDKHKEVRAEKAAKAEIDGGVTIF